MEQLALVLDVPHSKEVYREALQRRTPRAINTIMELMENPETPPNIRLQAAITIMHGGYGKPHQSAELVGADGKTQTINIMRFGSE